MDVKIGFKQSPQLVEVDMADDTDRDALKNQIAAAMADGSVIWLTDQKGKETAVPGSSLSFVEIGVSSDERKIGFGA